MKTSPDYGTPGHRKGRVHSQAWLSVFLPLLFLASSPMAGAGPERGGYGTTEIAEPSPVAAEADQEEDGSNDRNQSGAPVAEDAAAEAEGESGEPSAGAPEDGAEAVEGDRQLIFEAAPELLERVLGEMEIEFERTGDFFWSIQLGDYNAILLSDTVDIQLYAGFADVYPSLQRLNLWNMEHRFTRAYLDDELDPCLEADLDFEGGVSVGAIKQFIRLFEEAIAAFDRHLQ